MEEQQIVKNWVNEKAEKEGYAPLTNREHDYIWKSIRYNIAASSTSMDYGVSVDLGEAHDVVKGLVSPERLEQLGHLINHYWCGGEVCDMCAGLGYVDDVDSGHDYECPQCDGFGYVQDVMLNEDQ